MSPALIEALANLGIAAVVFGMAFFLFMKIHVRQMDDAKEDRHLNRISNRENAEAVASAMRELSASINKLRE